MVEAHRPQVQQGGEGGRQAKEVVTAREGFLVLAKTYLALQFEETDLRGGRGQAQTLIHQGVRPNKETLVDRSTILAVLEGGAARSPGFLQELGGLGARFHDSLHLGFFSVPVRVVRVLLQPLMVGGHGLVEFAWRNMRQAGKG
jgi:hypothetical protein